MASMFSGKAGRNASIMTAKYAGMQRDEITDLANKQYKATHKALQPAYQSSSKFLRDAYTGSSQMLNRGYDTARSDITSGYGQAAESLRGGYEQAAGAWQPFHDQSMAGYGMYQNALGLGGEAGTAAAQGAFKAGPGYQWNVDQATGQAARAANKYGGLYSGNTNDTMARLSSNLANQEYDKWVGNLQGFQGAAAQSSGALADIYGRQGEGLAGLQTGQAGLLGQLEVGRGTATSALRYGYGQDRASLRTGYGTGMANAAGTNYGQQIAATNQMYQTLIPSMQQGMMAGQQAAGNRMGAIMGGLQMGASIFGGGAGGGFSGRLFGG